MAKLGTEKNPVVVRVHTQERAQEVIALCERYNARYIIGFELDKPEDVSDVHRLIRERESAPKVITPCLIAGQNDPCPCGSGKAFKKCCRK